MGFKEFLNEDMSKPYYPYKAKNAVFRGKVRVSSKLFDIYLQGSKSLVAVGGFSTDDIYQCPLKTLEEPSFKGSKSYISKIMGKAKLLLGDK